MPGAGAANNQSATHQRPFLPACLPGRSFRPPLTRCVEHLAWDGGPFGLQRRRAARRQALHASRFRRALQYSTHPWLRARFAHCGQPLPSAPHSIRLSPVRHISPPGGRAPLLERAPCTALSFRGATRLPGTWPPEARARARQSRACPLPRLLVIKRVGPWPSAWPVAQRVACCPARGLLPAWLGATTLGPKWTGASRAALAACVLRAPPPKLHSAHYSVGAPHFCPSAHTRASHCSA